MLTHKGLIDLAVIFENKVFVIEFKCGQSAEAALQQIKDKDYAEKYKQSGRKLFLLGINFDPSQRNVSDWQVITQ